MRTYTELSKLKTFKERFDYLKLDGSVGEQTFGFDRYLNQALYKSPDWKKVRDQVILRDNGCDLGVDGYTIYKKPIIHHMNPITMDDIVKQDPKIMDPEYLICVTHKTHNAIHYGDGNQLVTEPIDRKPNDTCPWK